MKDKLNLDEKPISKLFIQHLSCRYQASVPRGGSLDHYSINSLFMSTYGLQTVINSTVRKIIFISNKMQQ